MERLAIARWWTSHVSGEQTLIVTPTNDAARRLNEAIQRGRHDTWQLGTRYLVTTAGVRFFVGDHVVTRHNDRRLRTDRGVMVRNHAEWTVVAMDRKALTLTVRGGDGTVTLSSHYIDNHLDLAYAQTIHAAQGRTVDRCVLIAGDTLDGRSLYVGMTRGRRSNDALVVTDANSTAVDVLAAALAKEWDDTPAIEVRRELGALRHDADTLTRFPGPEDDPAERFRQTLSELHPTRAGQINRSVDDDFGMEL